MAKRRWDPKAAALRDLDAFRECTHHDLVALARVVDEYEAAPGELLGAEGRPRRSMYIVVSGRAEVRRSGVVLWELGPGDLVGELGMFGPLPAATTTVAMTRMRLHALPAHAHGLFFLRAGLARYAADQLARRLRHLIGAPSQWTTRGEGRRDEPGPLVTHELR